MLKYLFYIIAIIIFVSCGDKREIEDIDIEIMTPYQQFQKMANGKGYINFMNANNSTIWYIATDTITKKYSVITPDTIFTTNNTLNISCSKLSGKGVIVEFEAGAALENFYIPKSLTIEEPKITGSKAYINEDTILRWSADSANIYPLSLVITSTEREIYENIYIEDSGEYKFESSLLERLESGDNLTVTVCRYNFKVLDEQFYKVHALSVANFSAIFNGK